MSCSSREDIAEIGHLTITKKGQKPMSKERLVELIGNAPIGVNGITLLDKHEPKVIEEVADYLLANGVIVVPEFAAYKKQNVITPECITQALEFMKSNRPIPDLRREVAFARLFAEKAEAKLKESESNA